MSCKIITSKSFLRAVKHLSKRYKSIKKDLIQLQESLQNDPLQGTDLGRNLRKVRMAITAKGKNGNGAVLGGHEQRDDATAERTDRHFPGTAVDA